MSGHENDTEDWALVNKDGELETVSDDGSSSESSLEVVNLDSEVVTFTSRRSSERSPSVDSAVKDVSPETEKSAIDKSLVNPEKLHNEEKEMAEPVVLLSEAVGRNRNIDGSISMLKISCDRTEDGGTNMVETLAHITTDIRATNTSLEVNMPVPMEQNKNNVALATASDAMKTSTVGATDDNDVDDIACSTASSISYIKDEPESMNSSLSSFTASSSRQDSEEKVNQELSTLSESSTDVPVEAEVDVNALGQAGENASCQGDKDTLVSENNSVSDVESADSDFIRLEVCESIDVEMAADNTEMSSSSVSSRFSFTSRDDSPPVHNPFPQSAEAGGSDTIPPLQQKLQEEVVDDQLPNQENNHDDIDNHIEEANGDHPIGDHDGEIIDNNDDNNIDNNDDNNIDNNDDNNDDNHLLGDRNHGDYDLGDLQDDPAGSIEDERDGNTESDIDDEQDARIESDQSDAGSIPPLEDDMSFVNDIGDLPLVAGDVARQYVHNPNPNLNLTLDVIAILMFTVVVGLGIGHALATFDEIEAFDSVQESMRKVIMTCEGKRLEDRNLYKDLNKAHSFLLEEHEATKKSLAKLRLQNQALFKEVDAKNLQNVKNEEEETLRFNLKNQINQLEIENQELKQTIGRSKYTIHPANEAGEQDETIAKRESCDRGFTPNQGNMQHSFSDGSLEDLEAIHDETSLDNKILKQEVGRLRYTKHPGNKMLVEEEEVKVEVEEEDVSSGEEKVKETPQKPDEIDELLIDPWVVNIILKKTIAKDKEIYAWKRKYQNLKSQGHILKATISVEEEDVNETTQEPDKTPDWLVDERLFIIMGKILEDKDKEIDDWKQKYQNLKSKGHILNATIPVEEEEVTVEVEEEDVPVEVEEEDVPVEVEEEDVPSENVKRTPQEPEMTDELFAKMMEEKDNEIEDLKRKYLKSQGHILNPTNCLNFLFRNLSMADWINQIDSHKLDSFIKLSLTLANDVQGSVTNVTSNILQKVSKTSESILETIAETKKTFEEESRNFFKKMEESGESIDQSDSDNGNDTEEEDKKTPNQKWSENLKDVLNKTRNKMSNVSQQIQKTWQQVKNLSVDFWTRHEPAVSKTFNKITDKVMKFGNRIHDKIQRKVHKWYQKGKKQNNKNKNSAPQPEDRPKNPNLNTKEKKKAMNPQEKPKKVLRNLKTNDKKVKKALLKDTKLKKKQVNPKKVKKMFKLIKRSREHIKKCEEKEKAKQQREKNNRRNNNKQKSREKNQKRKHMKKALTIYQDFEYHLSRLPHNVIQTMTSEGKGLIFEYLEFDLKRFLVDLRDEDIFHKLHCKSLFWGWLMGKPLSMSREFFLYESECSEYFFNNEMAVLKDTNFEPHELKKAEGEKGRNPDNQESSSHDPNIDEMNIRVDQDEEEIDEPDEMSKYPDEELQNMDSFNGEDESDGADERKKYWDNEHEDEVKEDIIEDSSYSSKQDKDFQEEKGDDVKDQMDHLFKDYDQEEEINGDNDEDDQEEDSERLYSKDSDASQKHNQKPETPYWVFKRANHREDIREQEKQPDWIFDRAREREHSRDKESEADWMFERASHRDDSRHSQRETEGQFDQAHETEKVDKKRKHAKKGHGRQRHPATFWPDSTGDNRYDDWDSFPDYF